MFNYDENVTMQKSLHFLAKYSLFFFSSRMKHDLEIFSEIFEKTW